MKDYFKCTQAKGCEKLKKKQCNTTNCGLYVSCSHCKNITKKCKDCLNHCK